MTLSGWINGTRTHCGSEEAQTMAEYAVILAVITPAIVVAFAAFSGAILPLISQVVSFL
jgi:Flp pilus assembly pilin Flp